MELKIRYLPEFTVAGVLGEGKSSEGPNWIPPLWERADSGFCVLKKTGVGFENGVWGIMGHPDHYLGRWEEQGLYLAGCETGKEIPLPEGWTRWAVPAQTYLVVDCSQTAYGAVFSKVLSEYLPAHGLQMIGAAHEHYPEPGNPEHVELYFPVAKGYLFCQSCGMPLTDDAQLGTQKDGGKNYDYCVYCMKDGAFTADCSMDQMIEFCLDVGKKSGMYEDSDKARREMQEWFPHLKRWQKAD